MLSLGFACEWSTPRERTWSHMPSSLLRALQARGDVTVHDLDLQLPTWLRTMLKVRYASYNTQLKRWTSRASQSAVHTALLASKLRKLLSTSELPDAVLSFSDYCPIQPTPQYIYFDMCAAELQRVLAHPQQGRFESVQYPATMLRRKVERQRDTYRSCRGLFAMSRYAAESAAQHYNLDRTKIHVVHSGVHVHSTANLSRPRDKDFLLFVGRDFERKGGLLVIEAFRQLRKQVDVDLVIAGPSSRDFLTSPPDGVVLLGDATRETLAPYFQHARLFVLPSYYEAYGIVFAEALSHGVPVIARNAFAMPEIIDDGVNGYLLREDSNSADELATLMIRALENLAMKKYVVQHQAEAKAYHSWERVADDVVRIINRDLAEDKHGR